MLEFGAAYRIEIDGQLVGGHPSPLQSRLAAVLRRDIALP